MLKVVFFFQESATGWSETYYFQGSDPLGFRDLRPSPGGGIASFQDLYLARRHILNSNVSIKHVRIGLEGSFRSAVGYDPAGDNATGDYDPGKATEIPIALLIDWIAPGANGQVFHRRSFLGGIPESIIIAPELYNDATAWTDLLNTFINVCKQLSVRVKSRPDRSTALPIANFLPQPDGRFAEIDVGVAGLTLGHRGKYVVRGVNAPRGWNGTHTGLVLTATRGAPFQSIGIGPTRRTHVTVPAYNNLEAGTVQEFTQSDTNYRLVTSVKPERITEHKRGRPFAAPVGRRNPA